MSAFLSDDPQFTGEQATFLGTTPIRVAMPAIINIREVKNFRDGKIINTEFTWSVYMEGRMIVRDDYYKHYRSRKAAENAAKRAARSYADLSKPEQ